MAKSFTGIQKKNAQEKYFIHPVKIKLNKNNPCEAVNRQTKYIDQPGRGG